jgi:HEPN domain-containing protein
MPPERSSADEPREWLNRARSNLALAKARPSETYLEDLCFEAQQAAEKAPKAMLIAAGVAFRYVHDLAHLLTVLEKAGTQIPDAIRGVESLTRYAVIARYPGLTEPVTEAHYHEALAFAEEVVRWPAQRIAPSQPPG